MSFSEIQERTARLNTQLRFGRNQAALEEAYKLRAFIQLTGTNSPEGQTALARAERVIAALEGKRSSTIQRLVDSVIRAAKASLNPNQEAEDTLLAQFNNEDEKRLDEQERERAESESDEPYPD